MKKSIEVDTNMVQVLKLTNWDTEITTHNIQKDLKKNVDNMWMGGGIVPAKFTLYGWPLLHLRISTLGTCSQYPGHPGGLAFLRILYIKASSIHGSLITP